MKGINKVILLGTLGDQPSSGTSQSGKTWARIALVTNKIHKDQSGNTTETAEWHRLIVWDKLADVAVTYLNKGSQIYVEGELHTRSYEKNGQKLWITEITVKELLMLGGGKKSSGNSSKGNKPAYNQQGQQRQQQQNNGAYGQQYSQQQTTATYSNTTSNTNNDDDLPPF